MTEGNKYSDDITVAAERMDEKTIPPCHDLLKSKVPIHFRFF